MASITLNGVQKRYGEACDPARLRFFDAESGRAYR